MGGMLDSWQQLERWASRHTSGIRGEAKLISARADSLQQAIRLSEGLAVYWILRDFRELDLQGVVNDIVEVLRQCLVVMLSTTGGGALIGGIVGGIGGAGVGAIPGVVVGAGAGAQVGEWILIAMGLKALAEYVVKDMPGIARDYWAGIRQAWLAATPPPLPQQPVRVDRLAVCHAAEKIARAHVAVFVLLLMGIVAYLAKGRGSMDELAESVRGSKVGPRFAEWLVRNEGKLKADPRLRAREKPMPAERINNGSDEIQANAPPSRRRNPVSSDEGRRTVAPNKHPGSPTAAPRLQDLEFSGLKAKRVLPGDNGTVAVIGRTMGNETRAGVRDYGAGLSGLGHKTELFDGANISKPALDEFQQLASQAKQDFAAGIRDSQYLTMDEVKQTMLYKENIEWATKLKAQGYTVVDLGNPYNLDNSAFYDAETKILFPGN